jgi:hypothetical protein
MRFAPKRPSELGVEPGEVILGFLPIPVPRAFWRLSGGGKRQLYVTDGREVVVEKMILVRRPLLA